MEEINERTTDLKRVVIIGPESTGKSTLASLLAKYYNTSWVPEYAREYIERLDRPYIERDLRDIAKGQIIAEDREAKYAKKLMICDTNLLVVKVWSEHKFGACYDEILAQIKTRKYDLYILTNPDVPWKEDPQREHPQLREFFYDIYREEIKKLGVPFVELTGEEFYYRKLMAVSAIDRMMQNR
jgi:NadR type nicotinamide-nucleotide adenylyltransferase